MHTSCVTEFNSFIIIIFCIGFNQLWNFFHLARHPTDEQLRQKIVQKQQLSVFFHVKNKSYLCKHKEECKFSYVKLLWGKK